MRALICGITGQDGSYLAQLLLSKGYQVIGTSRDAMVAPLANLQRLGVRSDVELTSMAVNDFRSTLGVIQRYKPDEIYNLAGQTSVGLSFEQPVEAMESISQGTLNILEAIKFVGLSTRFYNAGSSECFGDTGNRPADELTPFQPRSPYAVAKSAAHWLVRNYREAYGIFGCTGILFNHESPLRPERFVTQKIVRGAWRIARTGSGKLKLGNLGISRDWGWAPDYVEAMWLMLRQNQPDDYVIATGRSYPLEYFVEAVFTWFGLDWHDHVIVDQQLCRPSDISVSLADPSKAAQHLGWRASRNIGAVVDGMCTAVASE